MVRNKVNKRFHFSWKHIVKSMSSALQQLHLNSPYRTHDASVHIKLTRETDDDDDDIDDDADDDEEEEEGRGWLPHCTFQKPISVVFWLPDVAP